MKKGECEMARVISMSDAINEAMKLAMRKDDNVLVIGEDVACGSGGRSFAR